MSDPGQQQELASNSQPLAAPSEEPSNERAADKPRVAVITFSYAPLMTGISAGVHDRVVWLLKSGHAVRLLHPEANDEPDNSEMYGLDALHQLGDFSSRTFPTTPNPLRRSWPQAQSWKKWSDSERLADFNPDMILVDDAAGIFGASSLGLAGFGRAVGVEYAREAGIPSVNLIQTDWRGYAEQHVGKLLTAVTWPIVMLWLKKLATSYDLNIAPSQFLKQRYFSLYRGNLDHVHFHGVDCEAFCPENVRHDPLPHFDGPLVLFTGRIAIEKNLFQLLTAFERVLEEYPDARLAILGSGPLLKRLERNARSRFDASVILPGPVFGDRLKGWYARASVYWTASVTENFSTGILEALASGVPVVAAAAGGNTEQVEHGISGFLTPPGDTAEMADQTVRLLRDPDLMTRFRVSARTRGLEFDVGTCTQKLLDHVRRFQD